MDSCECSPENVESIPIYSGKFSDKEEQRLFFGPREDDTDPWDWFHKQERLCNAFSGQTQSSIIKTMRLAGEDVDRLLEEGRHAAGAECDTGPILLKLDSRVLTESTRRETHVVVERDGMKKCREVALSVVCWDQETSLETEVKVTEVLITIRGSDITLRVEAEDLGAWEETGQLGEHEICMWHAEPTIRMLELVIPEKKFSRGTVRRVEPVWSGKCCMAYCSGGHDSPEEHMSSGAGMIFMPQDAFLGPADEHWIEAGKTELEEPMANGTQVLCGHRCSWRPGQRLVTTTSNLRFSPISSQSNDSVRPHAQRGAEYWNPKAQKWTTQPQWEAWAPKRAYDVLTCEVTVLEQECVVACLSYVWAQWSDDELRVTLRKLSDLVGITLWWVDRWCINQWDEEEKSIEVSKMGHYYESAPLVVCLVPEVKVADPSMIPYYNEVFDARERWVADFRLQFMGSLWISRVWTYQEAMLARRTLVCGHDITLIEGRTVEALCDESIRPRSMKVSVLQLCNPSGVDHGVSALGVDNEEHKRVLFFEACRSWRKAWWHGGLTHHIAVLSKRSCAHEEDRVYGVMGICDVQVPVKYGEGLESTISRALDAGALGMEVCIGDEETAVPGKGWINACRGSSLTHWENLPRSTILARTSPEGLMVCGVAGRLIKTAGRFRSGHKLVLDIQGTKVGILVSDLSYKLSCCEHVVLCCDLSGNEWKLLFVDDTSSPYVRRIGGRNVESFSDWVSLHVVRHGILRPWCVGISLEGGHRAT